MAVEVRALVGAPPGRIRRCCPTPRPGASRRSAVPIATDPPPRAAAAVRYPGRRRAARAGQLNDISSAAWTRWFRTMNCDRFSSGATRRVRLLRDSCATMPTLLSSRNSSGSCRALASLFRAVGIGRCGRTGRLRPGSDLSSGAWLGALPARARSRATPARRAASRPAKCRSPTIPTSSPRATSRARPGRTGRTWMHRARSA